MKGFYIQVKNGLLDPKHIHAMGGDKDSGTVWLFLWLLDKMTIINYEIGEGKVLGGKPIRFEEVQKDLGISRRTYSRWIKLLTKYGYIKTLRTPYGLCITVFKAFKMFGQKSEKKRYAVRGTSLASSWHITPPRRGTSNKTIQLDITKDPEFKILTKEEALIRMTPKPKVLAAEK